MNRYNDRGEKISKNKNGMDVVLFKDRKKDFITTALADIGKVQNILRDKCSIEIMPIYGTLLGIIRDGSLMPNDHDFDFCYISDKCTDDEICSEALMIVECLHNADLKLTITSFGFIQVFLSDTIFNIYLGWKRENNLFLYFGISDGVPAENIIKKGMIEIHGQTFTTLLDPVLLLKAIYGEEWNIPNCNFSYPKRIQFHKNFNFLISGWPKQTGSDFWDTFYKKRNIPDYPSQYAISLMPELKRCSNILDIGCGNGRDSLFFSSHGHQVVGVDGSKSAINSATEKTIEHGLTASFKQVNIYEPSSYDCFIEHHKKCFDTIYARFFIHAIDVSGEISFWKIAKSCLSKHGKIYIEARTVNDPFLTSGKKISDTESISGHYRRFIEPETLVKNAEEAGFSLVYKVVGQGMAKFREEDPEVVRCTFEHKQV
ncbi:MAG: class I SAM-dependent methyltransferase [Desulfuromonadaceae bacterium]|nr:class I SAM-dependent methyltransferase [Desulfuromonadaceae bacterium]MDD2854289.1 class I SAM-dependent methyltransferase [Desulfuromonadaceae bacterium]